MKKTLFGLLISLLFTSGSFAQNTAADQEIIQLSKQKWQWMADKDVDKLNCKFQ